MTFDPTKGQEPGSGPSGSGNDAPTSDKRGAIGVALIVVAFFIVVLTLQGC